MAVQSDRRFGRYGGRYVPETLMPALAELEQAWADAAADPDFRNQLDLLLERYAGRPTPLYAAERLSERAGSRILLKREDLLHTGALWTTALASIVVLGAANQRWYFAGFSKSQEASKTRFTRLRGLGTAVEALPLSVVRRQLLIKDLKIFLRDVGQWSQLLLLLALVLVYLYNFRVLDLERIPYMSAFVKNIYAFVNLGMAGFVMATVAVRFVFPAVSAEGAAFWIIRTAPISLRDFLWSKFWTGLVPVLLLTEGLTVVGNEFLGVDPFLKVMSALAIVFMSFALVGLAVGLGARYPRFDADASQVAGSYGGVAFMMQAVLFIIVMLLLLGWPSSLYLFRQVRRVPLTVVQRSLMLLCFVTAVLLSLGIWMKSMREGVRALERMGSE